MSGALGEALIELWGGRYRRSYTAKGWHAQISKITETAEGARAAARVGLVVKTRETLLGWLSETQTPNKANQAKINEAYQLLAGKWNPANERGNYAITGKIDSGDRVETRTLNIDAGAGVWRRIRTEYESSRPDPKKIEDLFIEDVIVEDIGETSPREGSTAPYGWAFPGPAYTVVT